MIFPRGFSFVLLGFWGFPRFRGLDKVLGVGFCGGVEEGNSVPRLRSDCGFAFATAFGRVESHASRAAMNGHPVRGGPGVLRPHLSAKTRVRMGRPNCFLGRRELRVGHPPDSHRMPGPILDASRRGSRTGPGPHFRRGFDLIRAQHLLGWREPMGSD